MMFGISNNHRINLYLINNNLKKKYDDDMAGK